jgi:hypothetical protein
MPIGKVAALDQWEGTVAVELLQAGPVVVRLVGPVTGTSYEFSVEKRTQVMDARDAAALTRRGVFCIG